MIGYFELLGILAPVFILIVLGATLRWRQALPAEAERSIITMVVNIFYPCLITRALLEADGLGDSAAVFLAPVVGFVSVTVGFALALGVARLIGLRIGAGLRTFCFAVGIYNYGYIPVPLVQSLWGPNELATLFAHNVGIELAIWTIGLAMLSRASWKDGLARTANPMTLALVVGLGLNVSGLAGEVPSWAMETLRLLGACAIPLGIIAIGAAFHDFLGAGERLWDPRENVAAVGARLAILPALMLLAAWLIPASIELKRVMVIQAAMPAGIMPVVLAKRYGGQPLVAARVIISTTVVGLAVMPFWIRFGLEWVLP